MTKLCRIVMAQCNATVGNIRENIKTVIEFSNTAKTQLSADVIVFPELMLTGYPPEDLLYRSVFLKNVKNAIEEIKKTIDKKLYCIIGHPRKTDLGLQNCASILYNGKVLGTYAKQCLPNTDVFNEARYFIPGNAPLVINIHGIPMGIVICEDLWQQGPGEQAVKAGARLLLSLNASPFSMDKEQERALVIGARAKTLQVPIVYVNTVGAQEDLVFDGGSSVFDAAGQLSVTVNSFESTLYAIGASIQDNTVSITKNPLAKLLSEEARMYRALTVGLGDYVEKQEFPRVFIGLSGGIDSALSAAIAVDTLGAEKVIGVLMPSRFTSKESMSLALEQVALLGIKHHVISIEQPFTGFLNTLSNTLKNANTDVTEQNLQARCRGVILMALSNALGGLVLSTGNRSELAVGYATLYGDMAGGFCMLTDVPKTWVYRLAKYRNAISRVIPQGVITRAPSAELAPNQKDTDSLPPYEILDRILELYINEEQDLEDIVKAGFDRDMVKKIIRLVKKNEYKRRQAAFGVRLHKNAFGRGRRYPIYP